jgi:hypothetical protein
MGIALFFVKEKASEKYFDKLPRGDNYFLFFLSTELYNIEYVQLCPKTCFAGLTGV